MIFCFLWNSSVEIARRKTMCLMQQAPKVKTKTNTKKNNTQKSCWLNICKLVLNVLVSFHCERWTEVIESCMQLLETCNEHTIFQAMNNNFSRKAWHIWTGWLVMSAGHVTWTCNQGNSLDRVKPVQLSCFQRPPFINSVNSPKPQHKRWNCITCITESQAGAWGII